MQNSLILLLAASVALAGCSGTTDTDDTPDAGGNDPGNGDGTGGSGAGGNGTGGSGGGTALNRAPVAIITADVASGQAPLDVAFTLNGTDADGDALTWTLSSGIDGADDIFGDALPGEALVTYDAVGDYVAVYTLSDGTNSTVANYNITVLEADVEVPVEVPAPIVFSGSFAATDKFETETMSFDLAVEGLAKATVVMDYNEPGGGVPEVDNDLDWTVSAPGGQGGSAANYGMEDPIEVKDPKTGTWSITIEAYSVFPTGMDWTVTVTFE